MQERREVCRVTRRTVGRKNRVRDDWISALSKVTRRVLIEHDVALDTR